MIAATPSRSSGSDSWDDNLPTDCLGPAQSVYIGGVTYPIDSCAETLRTWNQVRPAVFDGGYAFSGLASGIYIVEVVPPPGYEIVKEEDKNVDFGETYKPSPLLLPPVCVGDNHLVPDFLTLFPDEQIPAPFAGEMRPLCDRKQVEVVSGKNAAADVFIHTEVSKSGLHYRSLHQRSGQYLQSRRPECGGKTVSVIRSHIHQGLPGHRNGQGL